MSSRLERRLLCVRRRVPTDRDGEYQSLWKELAELVAEAGSHAWRFVAPHDRTERLEFLEFETGHDPRSDPRAGHLLDRLDQEIGSAAVEEWLEDR